MFRCALLIACMEIGSFASAEGVHKCVTNDGISYQGIPCAGAEASLPAELARPVQVPATLDVPATPDCTTVGSRPVRPPWRHTVMCIGITDDEVLNLAGWGRPSRITRRRMQRGWEEEWTYESLSARTTTLRFINTRLATIETQGSPAMLVASVAPPQP